MPVTPAPLSGLRVLDLSRVLAGPSCTQILGDMGADIIKVERPGTGDDTRQWGPPFQRDENGNDTSESAYYLSCNRNKRSIAIDITTAGGQALVHEMLRECDVLIENFKTGDLKKYGLDFESVHHRHPHIVYASITGFGQTGPMAAEPGYDLMVQAMGGLMAITGEPDGEPMKTGIAISDIMTGLYAAIGILGALHARQTTHMGQHVDVALLDCTMASLTNLAQYYLTGGDIAPRFGNAHATIVPYQSFAAADGWIVIAVGNDNQFARMAHAMGHGEWAADERFSTNRARLKNRTALIGMMTDSIRAQPRAHWVALLTDANIPCSPVNTIDQSFALDQAQARNMTIRMQHGGGTVNLVGSPLKFSGTPVQYRHAPPTCGQHTRDILREVLKRSDDDIEKFYKAGIIA